MKLFFAVYLRLVQKSEYRFSSTVIEISKSIMRPKLASDVELHMRKTSYVCPKEP
jgi:hypothetical protein